ncbi:type VI secretion system protein TssA [Massilia genomosp. 1]|uniref:Type VI secretion system protein TssA n=1 Tax=Massilia genomosp. 1 TaxID=2609280 RepID=A0ABX0MTS8_9BURK|nr:type VI secretion system protein TssA [Massilia genomosp. 1]NHZ66143.1 type VI secretion system protein TssA [Massilia genomosp. 1]
MSVAYLLQPLDNGGPCGIALLHEPEYDAIAAARHEDDPLLPRGVWTSELKRADWPEVVRLCEQALTERSKDLQVAAWLGEAWIALDGLAGGVRATQLLQGLCERFWDQLHPLPRNGDMEFRTAPFDWADENWSTTLMLQVPLVRGGGVDACMITLAQWRQAMAVKTEDVKKAKAGADGEKAGLLTGARAQAQMLTMPVQDIAALCMAARQWRMALDEAYAAVEQAAAMSAPRWRKLAAVLGEIETVLRHGEQAHPEFVGTHTAPETVQPELALAAVAESALGLGPVADPISGREDAYRRLGIIADYLAKTDPHSPVPSLIRRAISWGRMPFEQLLGELTSNNNEMQKLLVREPVK